MDKNIYGKLQPQQYHGTYQPYRCTRKNGSKPGCKFVYLNFYFKLCVKFFRILFALPSFMFSNLVYSRITKLK